MSKVTMPNNKKGSAETMQTAGQIVGGVVGGIYGGPAGAMEGAGTGGAVGGTIGKAFAGNSPTPQAVQSESGNDAISRRMQQDPGPALQQADAALAQLPPQYEDQYGATIRRARMLEEQQRRGMV